MSAQDTEQQLWGGETTKAVANFPVSGERVPVSFDAQLALLTAQTNALRATFDVYLAAAELDRALGRPIPLLGQTQ